MASIEKRLCEADSILQLASSAQDEANYEKLFALLLSAMNVLTDATDQTMIMLAGGKEDSDG